MTRDSLPPPTRLPLTRRQPGASLARILWFETCRWGLRALYRVFYRPIVLHPERVPDEGACLIAANHQSYLDPPFAGIYVRRQTNFIARSGLFKSRFFAWLISSLNATPIKEEGSDAGAIKEVLRRLAGGHAVVIFPEGSRTPDGAMHEFKRGVALLVKRAKCPVIPTAIEGCADAFPRGKRPRLYLLGPRIAVNYAHPIAYDDLMKDGPDAALRRLETVISELRMELRAKLRERNRGIYPPHGPGDSPLITQSDPTPDPATERQPS